MLMLRNTAYLVCKVGPQTHTPQSCVCPNNQVRIPPLALSATWEDNLCTGPHVNVFTIMDSNIEMEKI